MRVCQSLLALAAVLATSVKATSFASPRIHPRAEDLLDAPETRRLDLAYQEAVFRLGADKVGKNVQLGEGTAEPNWSEECIFTPYILIQPESAHDVSTAIRIIKKHNIKFATYGGGHAPHPGFAGITKGALIHLGRLNHTAVSDDRQIASLGPGGRWGHVVNALAEYDVYISGGRVPIVGVGGVLLGGGLHHTQPEFGLAADNIHNVEIVLSDGSIVNANAKENKDLFWALKGGGANFGIVTRFDIRALPVKDVWYQWGLYPLENRAEIFEAFVKWQLEYSDDVKATIGFIVTLTEINIYMIYTSHDVNFEAFGPLFDIEPTSWLLPPTNGTFGTLSNELWGFAGPGQRHEGGTASFFPDTKTYLDVFEYWYPKATAVHESTGANISFVLQAISHNAAKVGEANGGNALNIVPKDHTWWTSSADWDNAEDDDTVRAVTIDTFNHWDKVTKERGLYLPLKFMNDCSRVQNPLASYGKKNLQRLKQIAAKYDPSGFFQKQQNNGFLVSRA